MSNIVIEYRWISILLIVNKTFLAPNGFLINYPLMNGIY
jgi:hypothetical protein